eukprot:scaffold34608_cov172-Amphora_coffeaeformis.AAC.13
MNDVVGAVPREEALGGEGGLPHKIEDSSSVNDSHVQEDDSSAVKDDDDMRVNPTKPMETSIETLKEADPEPSEEPTSPSKHKKFEDYSGYELGGKSDKPAYCLLDGFMQEGDDGVKPFRVAIDRLPATLGRSHATREANFFGLGKTVKALSRFQCRIDYRVPSGSLGQFTSEDEFSYRAGTPEEISNPTDAELTETGTQGMDGRMNEFAIAVFHPVSQIFHNFNRGLRHHLPRKESGQS